MPLRRRGSDVIYGGSQIPEEQKQKVDSILDELEDEINTLAVRRSLKRAVVRTRLPCLTYTFINSTHLFVLASATDAITSTIYLPAVEGAISVEDVQREGIWEYGLEDPFVFRIRRRAVELERGHKERTHAVQSLAQQFVEAEIERMMEKTQLMTISPIFGRARFRIQENLCLVIMPFRKDLDDVYENVVKPTIEGTGLVSRRADDIRGHQPIMGDIWKSICEAHVVVADLTGRNPNVFYELGIAHTVGKKTILISQQEEESIPFDISHIRQIRYSDNASGLATLRDALVGTLKSAIDPEVGP